MIAASRVNQQSASPSKRANIVAVFMAKSFMHKHIFDLVSSFIKWWPEIERKVAHVTPGTSLEVSINGKIELL